jgi:hypothetical protein
MKKLIIICLVMEMIFLGAESRVNAAITGTNVSAGMRIDVAGVTEVSGSNTDATYASVDLISPSTGARVSSLLHINSFSAEAANLKFNLLLDGNNNMPLGSYLGYISWDNSNVAEIFYHADIDFAMKYSWNFDYIGPEPRGLNRIWVKENGTTIAELGNTGIVGHHEGSYTFGLLAGHDYTIQTIFNPNILGDVGYIEGTLAGDISFNFVPEPTAICLLGLGAVMLRRKRC